jgi:phenylacetate-CoA ligase
MLRQAYGELFRRVLQPAWEGRVRHRPTIEYLRRLEETQWLSRDQLEAIQLDSLRKLLRHAWNHVPYYRQQMDEAGLLPEHVRTLDDLRQLPILTREKASDAPEARMSTAAPFPTIKKSTSGSTGKPLVFAYDVDSEAWRQATRMRGYQWAGWRNGKLAMHYWGDPHLPKSRKQRLKAEVDHLLRRERYVDCGSRSDASLRQVVDIIRREKPECIVCYTQAGADLARHVIAHDLRDWGDIPVICGAERLFANDRAALVAAFGPEVYESYGSRETMLVAMESIPGEGLLVQMENIIAEVIVRDDDGRERPARPGEIGEVVITDLHNFGMPFIRYANGDLAVAGDDKPSACGRAHQKLASIEGRVAETLLDVTGNRVNGLLFNVLFAHMGSAIRNFQAIQHADRSITLKVVPGAAYDPSASRAIEALVNRYLPGTGFSLETVGELPPSASGKRQVVVVEH